MLRNRLLQETMQDNFGWHKEQEMNVIDENSTLYSLLVFFVLLWEHSLKQYRRAYDHSSPLLQTFPANKMTLKLDVLAQEGEIFQKQF